MSKQTAMSSPLTILTIIIMTILLTTTTTTIIAAYNTNNLPILTDRPVIGILAQPVDMEHTIASAPNRQYIAASYIKYIESAGGRVVPISWTLTKAQVNELLPKLNGVLLTGGDSVYTDILDYILDKAVDLNKNGVYFPVWGTCQGFQFMSIYFAQNRSLLQHYEVYNKSLVLNVTNNANQSTWYSSMPNDIKKAIATTPITMNFHHWGVGMEDYYKHKGLSDNFNLISTNYDESGVEHVTTIQHKEYPFVAVQWHPEKNNFEFGIVEGGASKHTTVHTLESIMMTQYCANWFVNECRKNGQKFDSWKELQAKLIYNHQRSRDGPGAFVENYIFDGWY